MGLVWLWCLGGWFCGFGFVGRVFWGLLGLGEAFSNVVFMQGLEVWFGLLGLVLLRCI